MQWREHISANSVLENTEGEDQQVIFLIQESFLTQQLNVEIF